MEVSYVIYQINVTYDVPTQLASLDLLKSEEMEGSTEKTNSAKEKVRMLWEETYLLELKSLKKKMLETCIYQPSKNKQLIA